MYSNNGGRYGGESSRYYGAEDDQYSASYDYRGGQHSSRRSSDYGDSSAHRYDERRSSSYREAFRGHEDRSSYRGETSSYRQEEDYYGRNDSSTSETYGRSANDYQQPSYEYGRHSASAVAEEYYPSRRSSEQQQLEEEEPPPGTNLMVRNVKFGATSDALHVFLARHVGTLKDVFIPTHSDTGRPRSFAFVECFSMDQATQVRRMDGCLFLGRTLTVRYNLERHLRDVGGAGTAASRSSSLYGPSQQSGNNASWQQQQYGGRQVAFGVPQQGSVATSSSFERDALSKGTDVIDAGIAPNTSLIVQLLTAAITKDVLRQVFGQMPGLKDVYIPRNFQTKEPRSFGYIEYETIEAATYARAQLDLCTVQGQQLRVGFAKTRRKSVAEMERDKATLSSLVVPQQGRFGEEPTGLPQVDQTSSQVQNARFGEPQPPTGYAQSGQMSSSHVSAGGNVRFGEPPPPTGNQQDGQAASLGGFVPDVGEGIPGPNIALQNLSSTVTKTDLHNIFERFGIVRKAYIPLDRVTHQPKGLGFIDFDSVDVAMQARTQMDGFVINGQPVRVRFSRSHRHKTPEEMESERLAKQATAGRAFGVGEPQQRMLPTYGSFEGAYPRGLERSAALDDKPVPSSKRVVRDDDDGPVSESLMVGNLSLDISEEDLRNVFGRVGDIASVYIPVDFRTKQRKQFAFVVYAAVDAASEARYEIDEYVLRGRKLRVRFSRGAKTATEMERKRMADQVGEVPSRSDNAWRVDNGNAQFGESLQPEAAISGSFGGVESSKYQPDGRVLDSEDGPEGPNLWVRNLSSEVSKEDLSKVFGRVGSIRDIHMPVDRITRQPKGFAFVDYASTEEAKQARWEMDMVVVKGHALKVRFSRDHRRKSAEEMERDRLARQHSAAMTHVQDVNLLQAGGGNGIGQAETMPPPMPKRAQTECLEESSDGIRQGAEQEQGLSAIEKLLAQRAALDRQLEQIQQGNRPVENVAVDSLQDARPVSRDSVVMDGDALNAAVDLDDHVEKGIESEISPRHTFTAIAAHEAESNDADKPLLHKDSSGSAFAPVAKHASDTRSEPSDDLSVDQGKQALTNPTKQPETKASRGDSGLAMDQNRERSKRALSSELGDESKVAGKKRRSGSDDTETSNSVEPPHKLQRRPANESSSSSKARKTVAKGGSKSRAKKEDDPMDSLSEMNLEFLASVGITTIEQFLARRSCDLGKEFERWRQTKGMAPLQGGTLACSASVSNWKSTVQKRAKKISSDATLSSGKRGRPKWKSVNLPVSRSTDNPGRGRPKKTLSSENAMDVLSERTIRFLSSVGIATADQFDDTDSSELGQAFVDWRHDEGLPVLAGNGAVNKIYHWKSQVRKRVAELDGGEFTPASNGGRRKKKVLSNDNAIAVLSDTALRFLSSIGIVTADHFVDSGTTDLGLSLVDWRREEGMSVLKGDGARTTISNWKQLVRQRMAAVSDGVEKKVESEGAKSNGRRTKAPSRGNAMDALSDRAIQFLSSEGISTAAEFIASSSAELGRSFVDWREDAGLPALKSDGALVTVCSWKRKVLERRKRNKAASASDRSASESPDSDSVHHSSSEEEEEAEWEDDASEESSNTSEEDDDMDENAENQSWQDEASVEEDEEVPLYRQGRIRHRAQIEDDEDDKEEQRDAFELLIV